MPKTAYARVPMNPTKKATIDQANTIIAKYQAQGFDLTLRQLYYQFVARGLIANKVSEYKRLGDVVNDGRMAGLIDWNAIVDRTRELAEISHWKKPGDVVKSAAASFRIDKWATQKRRIEVWVEKEALAGVMERACVPLDVPYLSCRGYVSQSEMWGASIRLRRYEAVGQHVTILHFGDHDPSGMDMSRDIEDRLAIFRVRDLDFRRLALNTDQIDQYNPPPNPAKITDSRYDKYEAEFGDESWELDALDPNVLVALVQREVLRLRDAAAWEKAVREEEDGRARLRVAAESWVNVSAGLDAKRVKDEIEEGLADALITEPEVDDEDEEDETGKDEEEDGDE
jgi:hypothetical protein